MSFVESIKKDVTEASGLWSESSLYMKLVIGVSLFLTASSITSLADTVFKWKGFILDAVESYRAWVVVPLIDFAHHFDLKFHPGDVDFLILCAIWYGTMVRVLISTKPNGRKPIRRWRVSTWIGSIIVVIFFAWNAWQIEGFASDIPLSITDVYLVIVLLFLIFLMTIIEYDYSNLWKMLFQFRLAKKATRRSRQVVAFGPIIFGLLVMLILGAVNSGLSRI